MKLKRTYKCVNLKPETDVMLTQLCYFLKTKKAPFLEELLTKLYEYFMLFKPRKGWHLDYDVEVTRSRLIIEFSGFPLSLVVGSFPAKTLLSPEDANKLIQKRIGEDFKARDEEK